MFQLCELNSKNFNVIMSLFCTKSLFYQHPKTPSFSGDLFSGTRNQGFKILPRIGNAICSSAGAVPLYLDGETTATSTFNHNCFLCLKMEPASARKFYSVLLFYMQDFFYIFYDTHNILNFFYLLCYRKKDYVASDSRTCNRSLRGKNAVT